MRNITLAFLLLFWIAGGWTQTPKDTIIFSHKLHMEGGAECATCHAKADSSLQPSDQLLPDMETCYQCHDREAACTLCHTDPDNAGDYARVTQYIHKFPHARHLPKTTTCTDCHRSIEQKEKSGLAHLPAMSACSQCHRDLDKPDYCYDCHAKSETLQPADHKQDWRKGHGLVEPTARETCKQCHSDRQCLQCHQGDNLDRQVHPGNFRSTHGLTARINKENCFTCHQDRQVCADCHRAEMVMPKTHASAGWSNEKTGGAHRRAAEWDLDDCMTCHSDQKGDPTCARCHQAR
jgi:hypothetical protein